MALAPKKDKKAKEKLSLEDALAALNKQYGPASIFHGSENISIQVESWSSGCLAFDSVLGCGIPLGRIIEISGPEGSGKTAFSASVIGYWQEKYNATCAFIDGEQTASPNWFRSLSVNWDKLLYSAPDTLEQVLDTIDTLASTGQVNLIVYDSIAALPSISEASKAAGDVNVAALSKVLTSALRKLTPVLAKNKCTVIFINQLREKIGAFSPNGGIPTTTPGGRALKHAASLRLEMKRGGGDGTQIKEGNQVVGHLVDIKCKKNKLSSAQGASASFWLHYTKGIDRVEDAITTAITIGIVERPNNVMYVYKDLKIKGYDNFIEALKKDNKVLEGLVADTQAKMLSGTTFVTEEPIVDSTDELDDNDE